MLRLLLEHRGLVSAIVAAGVWSFGHLRVPFPATNDMLVLVAANAPHVHAAIRVAVSVLWFTSPFLASSFALSFVYIFLLRPRAGIERISLPRYPEPAHRSALFLVLGEVHKERRPMAVDRPRWLAIPRRALFTGIGIFGAVGSGKTTCCMYPFAEQLLAYRRDDAERRIGGLVLEVKGDFCYRVREILRKHGREDDYIELSLDCPYRYNPLYNDLEAYALAYGIASLLTNLFGRGKEPFWQQAYTNVVKFIILLHKSVYGYVTLFDVYECAINPDLLSQRIAEGQALFEPGEFLLVDPPEYYDAPELKAFDFEMDPALDRMKVPRSDEVEQKLSSLGVPYTTHGSSDSGSQPDANRREQFEAAERWFHHDWMRIEPKLRTSIVEGISVFLSLFDDSPAVKRTFCPPKECYDSVANADGRYGKPLPPFAELVETGAVVALNFPVASNPGLAKAIGVFLKQDFQRAMLGRIPKMEAAPDRHWREVMFLCDEYHAFATVGESDPSGDEKFFSLSRQARCIPVIATQSISSLRSALPGDAWRTLLQTFRTKLFLTLSDDFSMSVASELCGKDEQLKEQYSIAENSQDARVSLFTGRTTSHKHRHHCDQELRHPPLERLRAQDLRGAEERASHRPRLRRPQPPAAQLLLPQALLHWRSPSAGPFSSRLARSAYRAPIACSQTAGQRRIQTLSRCYLLSLFLVDRSHFRTPMTIEDMIRRVVREEVRSAFEESGQGPDRALSTSEVADILGVVPRVVLDMVRNGEIRGWRLHGDRGDWRVNSRDLRRFLEERAEAA